MGAVNQSSNSNFFGSELAPIELEKRTEIFLTTAPPVFLDLSLSPSNSSINLQIWSKDLATLLFSIFFVHRTDTLTEGFYSFFDV